MVFLFQGDFDSGRREQKGEHGPRGPPGPVGPKGNWTFVKLLSINILITVTNSVTQYFTIIIRGCCRKPSFLLNRFYKILRKARLFIKKNILSPYINKVITVLSFIPQQLLILHEKKIRNKIQRRRFIIIPNWTIINPEWFKRYTFTLIYWHYFSKGWADGLFSLWQTLCLGR